MAKKLNDLRGDITGKDPGYYCGKTHRCCRICCRKEAVKCMGNRMTVGEKFLVGRRVYEFFWKGG